MPTRVPLLLFLAATACGSPSAPVPGRAEPATATREASSSDAPVAAEPDDPGVWFPETDFRAVRAARWGTHRALLADERVYASNGEDLPIFISLAAFGLLTPPSAERCGVIGLGGGVEASAAAALGCGTTDVFERRADELLPLVAELAPWVDVDALRIRTTPPTERYDVLVQSQASWLLSRPHRLFVVERLRALAGSLTDGGVLAFHLPVYHLHADTHRRVMATVAEAFPQVAALSVHDDPLVADLVVLASRAPIRIHAGRVDEWRRGAGARWLELTALESAEALPERVVFMDRAEVLRWAGDAAPYRGASPMSPGEVPPAPAAEPGADHDPDAQERFQIDYDAWAAQFEPFFEELARPRSPWGRSCREAASSCALFAPGPPTAR